MHKVLMVCLGNICRSPIAQGVLTKKVEDNNLDIEVDSAGTAAYHIDSNPDPRATAKASENNIDISQYRGRQFIVEDFDRFDTIFAMDYSNYENIIVLARNEADKKKVSLLLNLLYPGENMSVPDPYYGGEQGFEDVFNMVAAACDRFIATYEG